MRGGLSVLQIEGGGLAGGLPRPARRISLNLWGVRTRPLSHPRRAPGEWELAFFLTLFFWSVCYQCLVVLLNGDCVKNKK